MDLTSALACSEVVVGSLSAVNGGQTAGVEHLAGRIQHSTAVPVAFRDTHHSYLHVVGYGRIAAELLGEVLVLGRHAGVQQGRRVLVAGATGAATRRGKARFEERESVENSSCHAWVRTGIAPVPTGTARVCSCARTSVPTRGRAGCAAQAPTAGAARACSPTPTV